MSPYHYYIFIFLHMFINIIIYKSYADEVTRTPDVYLLSLLFYANNNKNNDNKYSQTKIFSRNNNKIPLRPRHMRSVVVRCRRTHNTTLLLYYTSSYHKQPSIIYYLFVYYYSQRVFRKYNNFFIQFFTCGVQNNRRVH